MQKSNGMNYAPRGKSAPVCAKGDFRVGVIGLDHGHIFGMCNGLVEAGAELVGCTIRIRRRWRISGKRFPMRRPSLRRRRSWKTPPFTLSRVQRFLAIAAISGLRPWTMGRTISPTSLPSPPWTRSRRPEKKLARRAKNTPSITASGCMWKRLSSRKPSSQTGRSAESSR